MESNLTGPVFGDIMRYDGDNVWEFGCDERRWEFLEEIEYKEFEDLLRMCRACVVDVH